MRTESAPKNLTAKRSTLPTGPGSYGASAFCYHPLGAGRGSVKDPYTPCSALCKHHHQEAGGSPVAVW
jgi:hypothetical protein